MTDGSSQGVLQESFNAKTKHLFDIVDELRKIGIDKEISLPSVVVLGDQSSGKSSILESLSCMKLPKGSGMVTKCPLIIEMKKSETKYFSISFNENLQELDHIEQFEAEISKAQEEICGNTTKVVDNPITLKICSSNSPNLTLIDLPGLTRQAVQGQPKNMPEQIKNLAKKYIQRESTLILCVIGANQDPEMNESTKLAKQFDPNGDRTLGVITKCDLIDSDQAKERVLQLFNGMVLNESMKHGFVMVRCRSQREVEANVSLQESLNTEVEFFKSDSVLKKADQNRVSVQSLSKILTENLYQLIQQKLPTIHKEISEIRSSLQIELKGIPTVIPDEKDKRQRFLDKLFQKFCQELERCLVLGKIEHLDLGPENAFNKWKREFDEFANSLSKRSNSFMMNEMTAEYFHNKIEDTQGRNLESLFHDPDIMNIPLKRHIENYENDAKDCLDKVSSNVQNIINRLVERVFKDIPNAVNMIKEECQDVLIERKEDTFSKILYHLEEEKEIYTVSQNLNREKDLLERQKRLNEYDSGAFGENNSNRDFVMEDDTASIRSSGGGGNPEPDSISMNRAHSSMWSLRKKPKPQKKAPVINLSPSPTPSQDNSGRFEKSGEEKMVKEKIPRTMKDAIRMQELMYNYLRVVINRFSDQLPMCIFTSFNRKLVETLSDAIYQILHRDDNILDTMAEDEDVRDRRISLKHRIEILQKGERNISLTKK